MTRITLPQLGHEVTIEHGLSHLDLVLIHFIGATMVAARTKTTDTSLIEDLIILVGLSVHVWQHVVNARVVRRLQHDSLVSRVHLIDR